MRLRPEHAGHVPVDSHNEAKITRNPRGRLVVAGTRQTITEVLTDLSRHLENESNEVTTKPTEELMVRTKEGYNLGVQQHTNTAMGTP